MDAAAGSALARCLCNNRKEQLKKSDSFTMCQGFSHLITVHTSSEAKDLLTIRSNTRDQWKMDVLPLKMRQLLHH